MHSSGLTFLFLIGHNVANAAQNSSLAQVHKDQGLGGACAALKSALVAAGVDTELGDSCAPLLSPKSVSLSGGWCLASLTSAGWYRSSALNEPMSLLLLLDSKIGQAPVATASNSGGTMFVTRYFAVRDTSAEHKWSYPCYLLNGDILEVCYFHGKFGIISEECASENMNVMGAAMGMTMGGVLLAYGGPMGVAATYSSVYYPFLSDLPIPTTDTNFLKFWMTRAHYDYYNGRLSSWIVAYTLDSPAEAQGRAQSNTFLNYGWASYLSRGMPSTYQGAWFGNWTIFAVASVSANTLTAFNTIPMSFSGKSWDGETLGSPSGTVLKIYGLALSFAMVKRMMMGHMVLASTQPPQCGEGCILMDGGFSDNGPLTPSLAFSSRTPAKFRPGEIMISGPSDTFAVVKFLAGLGPLNVWGLTGVNVCPFTQTSVCTILGTLRKLAVGQMPEAGAMEYWSLANAFGVYKPQAQAISPFCGDPLIMDHFMGQCKADGMCHMYITVIPGGYTNIAAMVEEYVLTVSMILLSATPVASRFVQTYIPDKMMRTDYYHNMADWFPDFVAIAPQKGGVGFTRNAGHSLLDFMTYLVQRLTLRLVTISIKSAGLYAGALPYCGWEAYAKIEEFNTGTM